MSSGNGNEADFVELGLSGGDTVAVFPNLPFGPASAALYTGDASNGTIFTTQRATNGNSVGSSVSTRPR